MARVRQDVLLIVRVSNSLTVAIPSCEEGSPFVWQWRNVQSKRASTGFRVMFPSAEGVRLRWYRVGAETECFANAKAVADFAAVSTDSYTRADAVIAGSNVIRAQLRQLRCVYPDLAVASFTKRQDAIVVRVDLQWLCTVTLRTDGTWAVTTADKPDPVVAVRETPEYLSQMRANVDNFISMCAHFYKTGRVCANCSVMASRKMRRCPCKGAYYCGRECQKKHWALHKAGCGQF